jgi:hypothetical protein
VSRQAGDRLLSVDQQLEKPAAVRLGDDGNEITHRTIR